MNTFKWLKNSFFILLLISTSLFAHENDVQKKILALCADRYQAPGSFVKFSDNLIKLGVIRQTYDVINNELAFYSNDAMLYHFRASALNKSIDENAFIFGKSLDLAMLKGAINKLAHKQMSVVAFHKAVAEAGIVYVSVYLKQRTIYYFGQDGKYFLESY